MRSSPTRQHFPASISAGAGDYSEKKIRDVLNITEIIYLCSPKMNKSGRGLLKICDDHSHTPHGVNKNQKDVRNS